MIKQQYVMQFTTRTDYYQNFEISFDEFWETYCKENDFDEEESDLSQWDNEDLMDVASVSYTHLTLPTKRIV